MIAHLNLLGDLTEYIHRDDPHIEALCQFAVLRTFKHLGAHGLFVSQLGRDGKIREIGSFGLTDEVTNHWFDISIDDPLPASQCLKTNQFYWLASANDWARDFPNLLVETISAHAKTYIAWPIRIKGAPMSMLGLILHEKIEASEEELSFLTTVGGLFALHLSLEIENDSAVKHSEGNSKFFLSQRQKEILSLMAAGHTNAEIGVELAYSESTIRQETMRIYETLGVSGRADAIRKYRSLNDHS